MDAVSRLQEYVEQSGKIVFFGGAGVSTESGIPDFRSADGLYNQKYKYPPERILSHSFFVSHPEVFYDFYRERILHLSVAPNPAHYKLAELEKAGKLTAVITQNIDGLHQKAGSVNVLELHGSVWRHYCVACRKSHSITALTESTGVPRCDCGGLIRPDVVLYEETLDPRVLMESERHISEADLLIVGGTSLAVYPAAGLLYHYKGAIVIINKGDTPQDHRASLIIRESIGATLEKIRV